MIQQMINSIIVIESLPSDERQTGTEVYNNVIERYCRIFKDENTPIKHQLIKVSNKVEFLEVLSDINSNIDDWPGGVLLHVESHGSEDLKGLVLEDGHKVSWEEIKPILSKINLKLDNDLYVSMATCFGKGIHETIEFDKPTPIRAFISANDEVFVRDILHDFEEFFIALIQHRDLTVASERLTNMGSTFHYIDVHDFYKRFVSVLSDAILNNMEIKEIATAPIKVKIEEALGLPLDDSSKFNFDEVLETVLAEIGLENEKYFLYGKAIQEESN
jgi:hypothetical protein